MKLVYRATARDDLDTIFDFIAADNPGRAFNFIEEIRSHCRVLCSHPELGRPRSDLGAGIRLHPLRRRVVVAYCINPDAIEIIKVLYGGQDYAALLQDDP